MNKPKLNQIHTLLRSGDVQGFLELSTQYLKQGSHPESIKRYLEDKREELLSDSKIKRQEDIKHIEVNLDSEWNLDCPVIASYIEDKIQLEYVLKRLIFYILPFTKNVYLFTDSKIELPSNLCNDNEFDLSIEREYIKYKSRLHLVKCSFDNFSADLINKSVDLTQKEAIGLAFEEKSLDILRSSSVNAKCYNTSRNNRNEGSLYIQAVYDFGLKYNQQIYTQSDSKTNKNINTLKEIIQDDIAIVCNGPSVRNISTHYSSNHKQTAVTCNTTFMNEELHEYFNFKVIAFADPIFHFGISAYAAEFRKKLKRYLSAHVVCICIPQKYLHILAHHFNIPKKTKILVLKPSKAKDINMDLMTSNSVKVTGNVLTYLLFPLAASIANKRIILYGCDGRPSANNSYFWSHDKNLSSHQKKWITSKKYILHFLKSHMMTTIQSI